MLPGPLGLSIVSDASGSFLPQGVAWSYQTTVSFWLRMPLSRVCWLSVIHFTWEFHALVLHAWWLACGTSRSRTSRKGLLAYDQGASDSRPHPSPGREVEASVFGIAVRALLQALHPGLCLGWALWVFHTMSFSGSLSRSGGGVSFAFVTGFVGKTLGPSLAPRFAGFTVPAQPMRDNRNGRLLYPVRAVRCYLVRLG